MFVLVVDDDLSLRELLRGLLAELGCANIRFLSRDQAQQLGRRDATGVDLILLDLEPSLEIPVRRRLENVFAGTPVVSIGRGDYEATIETTMSVIRAERARNTKRLSQITSRLQRLERSNEDLQRMICIDPLTRIANRRHFDDLLTTEWARAARECTLISLVMLDLDDFHALNERYGHLGGDDCLRQVATAISSGLRRPSDVVARYGGEEFAALLPDTDAAGALAVAELLRARVEGLGLPHVGSRCAGVVTVSAGVATCAPAHEGSCDRLIAAADAALFDAKREGRNRVHPGTIHDPQVPERPSAKRSHTRPRWPS